MIYQNSQNLPEVLVNALKHDNYDPGNSDYTPSSLNKPPYMARLEKDHKDEIVQDVSDNFWILLGKTMHGILEHDTDNSWAEKRVYIKIDDFTIGMKFDNLQFKEGILDDYKLTSVFKFIKNYDGTWPEMFDWDAQLNIGAYILRQGGELERGDGHVTPFLPMQINQLRIIGLLRDWSKAKSKTTKGYPQQAICPKPIPIWNDIQCTTYIRERIEAHEFAKHNPIETIPVCSAHERWEKGESWAIMKNKNVKATKVCKKSELEAENALHQYKMKAKSGDVFRIEHRKPTRGRCESYCSVGGNGLCPDYNNFLRSV